jgi:hypothetical protein
MTSQTLDARTDARTTPDGRSHGLRSSSLTRVLEQITGDPTGASWALLLRAELEDAFDVALLRAELAATPTLSGYEVFATA